MCHRLVHCAPSHASITLRQTPKVRWYSVSQMINMQRSRLFHYSCHTAVVILNNQFVYIRARVEPHACATLTLCTNTRDGFLTDSRDAVGCLRSARILPSFRLRCRVCCMHNVFCRSISFAFDWSPNEYNIYKIVVYNAIGMGMWVNLRFEMF